MKFIARVRVEAPTDMPFITEGHWSEESDGFTIWIVRMKDWRHMAMIFAHEFIEWVICQRDGVTTRICDDYDVSFDKLVGMGQRTVIDEAGDEKDCPYFHGHKWGKRMERLFGWLLKVKWRDYCQACADLWQ